MMLYHFSGGNPDGGSHNYVILDLIMMKVMKDYPQTPYLY